MMYIYDVYIYIYDYTIYIFLKSYDKMTLYTYMYISYHITVEILHNYNISRPSLGRPNHIFEAQLLGDGQRTFALGVGLAERFFWDWILKW